MILYKKKSTGVDCHCKILYLKKAIHANNLALLNWFIIQLNDYNDLFFYRESEEQRYLNLIIKRLKLDQYWN